MSDNKDTIDNAGSAMGAEAGSGAGSTVAEATVLTASEVDELKARAAKAAENWDRLLRLTADFDNYKKRAVREREEAVKFANESLLSRLIPIMDNFEMALAALSQTQDAAGAQSLKSGIQMISQQLKSTLQEYGLEELDAEGKPFNPNFHEAVSHQESDVVADGNVLQQLRKGYKLRDRLIRPATVIVAKKPNS